MMKVVALLPVKNEEWILRSCLSSVSRIADIIIVLDDGSTDNSIEIAKEFGSIIKSMPSPPGKPIAMSLRRKVLLQEGRRLKGTHFIWLDADEAFTHPFVKSSVELIRQLRPGQKLMMQWLCLWKSTCNYRNDNSVWSNNFKDFIVCDKEGYGFEDRYLSEGRTPGLNTANNCIAVKPEQGAVLHFQFVPWKRFQMKQAWYRCSELIQNPQNASGINVTYSVTLNDNRVELEPIKKDWLKSIHLELDLEQTPVGWHLNEIIEWFDQFGVEFFEPLEIWHIQELRTIFIKQKNRDPQSLKHPIRIRLQSRMKGILFSTKHATKKIKSRFY